MSAEDASRTGRTGPTSNKAFLRRLPLFANLPEPDLDRLCHMAERRTVPAGHVVMEQDTPGDGLYIVIRGKLEVTREDGGRDVVLATRGTGEFLGEMSLLEQAPRSATVRAVDESELLILQPSAFHALLAASPDAAASILRTMASRLRSTESSLMEQEKLASLGTLAAGLAHELNNPAAAIQRAVSQMGEALESWQRATARLGVLHLDDRQGATLQRLETAISDPGPASTDALACSLEEDRLGDWLETHRVERGWEIATPLVAYGWGVERVGILADTFQDDQLPVVLHWLAAGLAARALRDEIDTSARQISAIVKAVKSYAFLDQAPVQDVDVRETLETTLVILKHRLKEGVDVRRNFAPDLPRIEAYGSELSQVWTNLIGNAIDAMDGHGTLTLRARSAGDLVVVVVIDDGPGIPPDIQSRIFDPFYTTKGPGTGTGLGLHIAYNIVANRHGGRITVESEPGRTAFTVALPRRLNRTDAAGLSASG
ncbi:MAG TPA: ATP-binding protein [Longimicrobiales bacterium]|nr:ATP-binding protein [Longimicrobiales bacterium]